MSVHHDVDTPTLSVVDPRSRVIRSIGYCRHPDRAVIEPRITRQVFDAAGRQVVSWDPRLWGVAHKPNLVTVYGLSDRVLLTDSVDAGWQLSLPDQAGSGCSFWNARGQRHTVFDEQQRPVALTEQASGEQSLVVERWAYADASGVFGQHNQCGRLIRHDDPAGARLIDHYSLAGAELMESRHFLKALTIPDWPANPDERDEYLEERSYVTRHAYCPTGELQFRTDAMGNVQTRHYSVAGDVCSAWLRPAGEGKEPECLVSDIRYNTYRQIERETAGNGVVTHAEYSLEDGRLLMLSAGVDGRNLLQHLFYTYNPVGNIVSLEDKSQAVTHFNGQRIEPISRFRYDSLYQLVEAKGWEVSRPSHGPELPELLPLPLDPNQRRNYTQTFDYDPAGNLITRQHSGAPGFSMFTSAHSNRSLAQLDDGSLPGESHIASGFDAAGNQLELLRGQAMSWDVRNQLIRVTLVRREGEPDDCECYVYDRPGHRLRKILFSQTSGRMLRSEVRYLPGIEIHCNADGVEWHVVDVDAGRNQVRMLHWPGGGESNQFRYNLIDHLGSSVVLLDSGAGIISQEKYYPFGGTACWASRTALMANHKSIRYSGKERDATGLYYFGVRYLAPWLQRWIGPDPGGDIDGLNFYLFCANDPVNYRDTDGFVRGRGDKYEIFHRVFGLKIRGVGLDEIHAKDAEAGQRLKNGLSLASRWAADTEMALQESTIDPVIHQIASLIFGTRVLVSDLLPKVKSMKLSVKEYEEGRRDIVWVKPITKISHGYMLPLDAHRRIFITDNSMNLQPESIAMTILHEVTHFRRDHEGGLGLGTKDYASYYQRLILPGPTIAEFIDSGAYDKEIARRSVSSSWWIDRARTFKAITVSGIQRALKDKPELRTRVLMKNADSLATFVTSVANRPRDTGTK